MSRSQDFPLTDTLVQLTAALADRYRVERELGRGGMATVYLAHDPRFRRVEERMGLAQPTGQAAIP